MRLFLILFFSFMSINCVFSFQYSEDDKQMFYTAFIDGYIIEMQKVVDSLDVSQEKKDLFMQALIKDIDRDFLVNSSWDCIKKFPVENVVSASILCTAEWNKKQSEKNKKLFEELKKENN